MARFSLSPSASCSTRRIQPQTPSQTTSTQSSPAVAKTPPQWKWNFPPQDQYYRNPSSPTRDDNSNDWSDDDDESSEDGSSSEESESALFTEIDAPLHSDDSDSDSQEEEPPHPLGFESRYGRTRFGLSPRSTTLDNENCSSLPPRDIYDRDDEYAWNSLVHVDNDRRKIDNQPLQQTFPPIQSYHLSGSVSTKQLLHGASSQISRFKREEDSMEELLSGMDRIANLLKAASHVDAHNHGAVRHPPASQPRSTAKLLQLAQACEHQQATPQREISDRQHELDRSYQQSCQRFLLLLKADAERVSNANERIAQRQRELEEMEEQERLDLKAHEDRLRQIREEEERAEAEQIAADAARTEEERRREEAKQEQLKQAEEEAELEAAQKDAHVDRAESLIENLDKVRSGGLREFDKSKSVSRRRLQFKKIANGKINTLSHEEHKILEVGKAVCDAISNAANDDATSSGGEPVMAMGKKYLLDLLCANLIVRVQADGFNGTRGDGFALAGMFAFVSTKCEEIGPVLEGHLYTVCPMAIPALSLKQTSAAAGEVGNDENDLMESLGMIKDKHGEFESFDKFLHRTEGLISIMTDIMSSLPSDHTLLGGHRGALTWLLRFMDLIPPPPASPLPLLTAPVLVSFLTGAGHMLANKYPTEFQKMFDAMKRDVVNRLDDSPIGVPSATRLRKVLDEWGFKGLRKDLPQGAVKRLYNDGRDASAGVGGTAPPPSFSTAGPAPPPFGTTAPVSSPFGTAAPVASPFGTATTVSSPFGAGAPAASPFGTAPTASSPFGAAPAPAAPFGAAPSAPAPSTFGPAAPASSAPTPSPFGPAAPAPVPFGAAAPSVPAPSPFGGAAPVSSPFGASPAPPAFGAAPSAPGPSPFGVTAPAPSAFGTTPGPSPFGATSFGAAPSAPGSSPFGGASSFGTAPAAPFGAAPSASAPSPFGGGGQGFSGGSGNASEKKKPCKFFASGRCNLGDRCKFSHEMGGGGVPSPFGNAGGQSSNSFGMGGGGAGSKKPPCKFFASGNCRNGDSCRFSHETGGSGVNASFGAFGNGGSTNNQSQSPFGGGGFGGQQSSGGGGGFGSSSPFGSAASASSTAGFGTSPFGGPRR